MISPFLVEHYETICRWWEAHKWPIIPIAALPSTGFIHSDDDGLNAVCFVYTTDSCMGMLEWITVNPDLRGEKRSISVYSVIDAAQEYANSKSMTLFTSIKNDSLKKKLTDVGFSVTDTDMTNLIYRG